MQNLMLLIFLTGLSACGVQVESSRRSSYEFLPVTYSNSPVLLKKQSENCQSKDFKHSADYELSLFYTNKFNKNVVNFNSILKQNFLQDGLVVSSTKWGDECEYASADKGWLYRKGKYPKDVDLCEEEREYARDSVEGAALNANFLIQKTYKNLKSVLPSLKIPAIQINISPEIKTSLVVMENGERIRRTTYMVDNAFYNPEEKSITFLPHSKTLKPFLNAYYWEIPMIASHEYGHHIFSTLTPHIDAKETTGCLGAVTNEYETPASKRAVTNQHVIASLNEGFADLIAYYTLPDKQSDVTGVRCLAVTRDPESSYLVDGRPKNFQADVTETFFSNEQDFIPSTCERPSFQDLHTFGSIFAYSADSFLNLLGFTKEEKLKYLIQWITKIDVKKSELAKLKPELFLKVSLKLFLEDAMLTSHREYTQQICQKITDIHPELDLTGCRSIL